MSLNARLNRLEKQHRPEQADVVIIIPDNERGSPEQQARIRERWETYIRTGKTGPLLIVPRGEKMPDPT